MELQFRIISSDELVQAYTLMRQLRNDINYEEFLTIYYQAGRMNEYTLTGAYLDDEFVGLMGCRILYDYVHGRHLYIDDLVVSAAHRSKGIGAKMLSRAEEDATRLNCNGVRLSTGVAREDGIRFYRREGWQLRAYTFKKGF